MRAEPLDRLDHAALDAVLLGQAVLHDNGADGPALRRERPVELQLPDPSFWEAVRSLPARQAQCIALYYLEDRPPSEIAVLLGIAEPTVRVHLHRGRTALATRLGEDIDEEET